ncbi:hypothetical protein P12024L_16 [Nonlabens phage P12024L]|uniref:Uncharacterized protein n=2 Tax=Inhavirus TaxID=1982244 RepID=I6R163_9CAUD|nr:hypothetical protein B617_gp15 [Nonlabens phage P12024S]YP_006560415.1 hypothetical protein B618_gp16 [Nonlabens phage P12024L]AFM54676.1 hypothetical protein P12024S_15 [Nonlabens phage P12024S]AFM54736.1 hypothetical protein P12024L_16 [Nonlabens phage P12024L]
MPDISMCRSTVCKARLSCYRFTATPNGQYQSYFNFTPKDDNGCENKLDLD